MHEDAANRVNALADLLWTLTLEAELRLVLQHPNNAVRRGKALSCRSDAADLEIGG